MLRLLAYLIDKGINTTKIVPELLDEGVTGLPAVSETACSSGCSACVEVCPTNAVELTSAGTSVLVDRGKCIACNYCVRACPTETLYNDRSTSTWSYDREGLIVKAGATAGGAKRAREREENMFRRSVAIRVVSTGCSACDLEIQASNNPIFDMERFGVHVVASPRFADVLLITGPVPKAMHEPVLSCYRAMAHPKMVIACGTCAISGGVHAGGYAEANGVGAVLPVDLHIPGCPPHPWQLIKAILGARSFTGLERKDHFLPTSNVAALDQAPVEQAPVEQAPVDPAPVDPASAKNAGTDDAPLPEP